MLSDFARNIRNNSTVLDLGTGNGIISILLCGKTNLKKIIGIEIQEKSFSLAKRNIELNKLEDKFEVINCDLNNLSTHFANFSVDAIVTNPPYKKLNTGKTNDCLEKLIARHEIKCSLEDVIKVSSNLLKNKGSFYMVHKAERLAEIIYTLKKYKLEPKRLRMVHPNMNKEPNLILIEAVKGANPFLKMEKPLFVYNLNNTYTNEIFEIYGKE